MTTNIHALWTELILCRTEYCLGCLNDQLSQTSHTCLTDTFQTLLDKHLDLLVRRMTLNNMYSIFNQACEENYLTDSLDIHSHDTPLQVITKIMNKVLTSYNHQVTEANTPSRLEKTL
jgi:hypothetical protein